MKNTCQDCTDRHPFCHSTCEKYKKFVDALEEDKAKERAVKDKRNYAYYHK